MLGDSRERTWATIDTAALKSNLNRVSQSSPSSKIFAVIKANAYGHGMEEIARVLATEKGNLVGFAVATIDEAVALRQLGTQKRILLLQGFHNASDLAYLLEAGIEFVVHSDYQLPLLKAALLNSTVRSKPTVWLKLDTGMNRLGLNEADFMAAFAYLDRNDNVRRIVVMSHLAWADEPDNHAAEVHSKRQLSQFLSVYEKLGSVGIDRVERSLAASAGILAWPDAHHDVVRPGIMLYGSSPIANQSAKDLGLQPVMTLRSRIIAIKDVPAAGSIGYGAAYRCEKNTRMGVVSIGYGDGYPRSVPTGTPVLVRSGNTFARTALIGRVSMDMITIDLTRLPDTCIGEEVVLWGEGLAADEVAKLAGTISYELFCQVTRRVNFSYF